MSEEVKFTNEQIGYVKHCLEHFEVLTGGRGHSKTKQIIEQLLQENQQLKSVLNEVREYIKHSWWLRLDQTYDTSKGLQGWEVEEIMKILDKVGDK